MVGVSYGKGVSVPEADVRWFDPSQVEALQSSQGDGPIARLRLFDARDEKEYEAGTLPKAELMSQTTLMFDRSHLQPLIDDLLASSGQELVFFANTAGEGSGMAAGREVWVMAFLVELGVPLKNMARLKGGLDGWKASGRALWMPHSDAPMPAIVGSFDALLENASLQRLHEQVAASRLSLEACLRALQESRVALLNLLKDHGLSLADRQALANALSKASREGRVGVVL